MTNFDDMDLESLLRDGIRPDELDLCRSGSAPPTVQGSRAAYRSLLGDIEDNENDEEEQLRKHPDYLSYYLGNGNNLNPRLPIPAGSREDWRAKQRFRNLRNGIETENMNNSLFKDDRFVGLGIGIGERGKSFADAIQQNPVQVHPISPHPSRPVSNIARNPSNDITLAQIHEMDAVRSCSTSPNLARVQSVGSRMSQSFASAVVGPSHPRITTPDPIARPTSRGPAIDVDMAAAFSCLNISNDKKPDGGSQLYNNTHIDQNKYLQQNNMTIPESYPTTLLSNNGYSNQTGIMSAVASNGQCGYQQFSPSRNLPKQTASDGQFTYQEYYPSKNSKQAAPLGTASPMGSNGNYLTEMGNFDIAAHGPNSYRASPGAAMVNSPHGQYLSRDHVGPFQSPIVDPSYAQAHYLNVDQRDTSVYNKAYLAKFLAQQRMIQGGSCMGETGALKNGFCRNSAVDLHIPYSTSIRENTVRHNDMLSRIDTTALRTCVGSKQSWNHLNGIMEQGFASTKLEEFKTNKTRSFELHEIVGHVVEFSGDQYGSRFIQQKLETASDEEKNILFPEILAHSRNLMIDVFGNYVIQKFFEHGTESQRSQLASQLMGHVLALSLQMYGCRVIQKALEVVNVDQQTQMVSELDGAVMRCVRDQNGNHVIQKCIECLPEDRIQFIICSFYGQVVALSTHPYGCRVIQRVLEHCTNEKTQSIMMEEILQSVCTLAQDQYGNYVIQHVLQHGKQEERAYIIGQLAGQIVKMSQQKFASNVVEKCLSFGSPKDRQVLIDEMLGSTDENEPLQAMMKDQFGNYVVQKVLETCDDQNRELILSRVKVHLNALKKYTYGKHIVARVEKLITAGERRSERSPSYAT